MLHKIASIDSELIQFKPNNLNDVEQFRIRMLGKNGLITLLFEEFRNVPNNEKREIGQLINSLKAKVNSLIDEYRRSLKDSNNKKLYFDLSVQSDTNKFGTRHPISLVKNDLTLIFHKLGFSLYEGPEIEDDWHVFSALNFPEEHPARDMQDTFFIQKNPDILLRTHTSSVQVRCMENEKLPIRVICPGRVFRNEAISARAHCIFHQIEGLYIDKNVSFADLKQTLLFFAREMFGPETEIRLRPSYFPFTEPSAEMDVSCKLCGGKGCSVCKYTGWLEVLGCGMVDPQVLELNGINSKLYSGYAFGMGLERIAMLKYQIRDLRLYFENDVRFLNHFVNFM
jgi:phenylalanyl-tRNA synthetase alpha chain